MVDLKITSKALPKITEVTFSKGKEKVIFNCELLDFYVKLNYFWYEHTCLEKPNTLFVFNATDGKRFVMKAKEQQIFIRDKDGKVIFELEVDGENGTKSFNVQFFYILHDLEYQVFYNYALEEIFMSKFFTSNYYKTKYQSFLDELICRYKGSEEYFLKDRSFKAICKGGGWSEIYIKTVSGENVYLSPGYITCVHLFHVTANCLLKEIMTQKN